MCRRLTLSVLLLVLFAVPALSESLEVLHPNSTDYSAAELAVLLPTLDDLTKVLNDYARGSQRWFTPDQWESLDFSAYTAGTLAKLGYETRLVQQGGWPDGVHTWVLVGIPLVERTAWIPVEASPAMGRKQPILGTIPSYTDGTGKLCFEMEYLDFSEEIPLSPNLPPVAIIRLIPTRNTVGLETVFMAATSYDPDPDDEIIRYDWNFGDGMTSQSQTVRHVFTEASDYIVSLTVTDSHGASTTTSITFKVAEPRGSSPGSESGGCGCGK